MDRRDWTLLALAAADGRHLTPVQLQKTLFLVGKKMPEAVGTDYYTFRAYNYGPFDARVYLDAETLAQQGLVNISPVSGQGWAEYSVSKSGAEAAAKLADEVDERALGFLKKVVEWARGRSFAQLVRAIYREYPEYRENSVFQD